MKAIRERPRILVITLRRLGDVLLTTPLIRALKMGFAGSSVDVLVFRGTEGMLEGNRDLDDVIVIPSIPRLRKRRRWACASGVITISPCRRRPAIGPRSLPG